MSAAGGADRGSDREADLADRLDAIAEELAELAIASLRRAIETKAPGRPADERRLTQARRAVEKAAALLRAPADDEPA